MVFYEIDRAIPGCFKVHKIFIYIIFPKSDMPKKKGLDSKKIMSAVIIFIMVSSVFGVILGNINQGDSSQIQYNGYNFDIVENRYRTEIDDKDHFFYFLPQEVLNINISEPELSLIDSAQAVYLVFDPDMEDLTSMDLVRFTLGQFFLENQQYIESGLTKESSDYPNINNILDCENATQVWPVILFKDAQDSVVSIADANPGCLMVESETYVHRIKFSDALRYRMLGIID